MTAMIAMAWRHPSVTTHRPGDIRGADLVGVLAASSRASSSVAWI